MTSEKYWLVAEIAEMLRCNVATIRRYLKSGRLTGIKRGGVWVINENDLKSFIAERKNSADTKK